MLPFIIKRLLKRKQALISLILLIVVFISAITVGLTHLDPTTQDLLGRLHPPGEPGHPLGTDQLGRDILARLIYGGRVSLSVGFVSVFFAAIIGSAMGVIAGYYGGRVDSLIMGLVEALLALPFIVLAIAVIGAIGPSLTNIIVVLAGTGWVTFAKLIRGKVMELKGDQFVEAARALGASDARIMLRHILPNALSLVWVEATLQLGQMIITEASLGFLGLGVQPPTPSWGNMLSEGQQYIYQAWWITCLPGIVIACTVLAVNTLGDFLRDVMDPEVGI